MLLSRSQRQRTRGAPARPLAAGMSVRRGTFPADGHAGARAAEDGTDGGHTGGVEMERPACNECRGTTTAVRASVSRRPEGRQPPRRGLIAWFMGALGDGRFFWFFSSFAPSSPSPAHPTGVVCTHRTRKRKGSAMVAAHRRPRPCPATSTPRMQLSECLARHRVWCMQPPADASMGTGGCTITATALPLTASTTAGTPALAATLATIPTTNPAAAGTTSHPQPPLCLRAGFGRGGCTHK